MKKVISLSVLLCFSASTVDATDAMYKTRSNQKDFRTERFRHVSPTIGNKTLKKQHIKAEKKQKDLLRKQDRRNKPWRIKDVGLGQ